MSKPVIRLVAKNKTDGTTLEIGAGWANNFGGYNLRLHTKDSEYTRDVRKVIANLDDHFINLWPIRDAQGGDEDTLD
jgi:hypothetical protein